MEFFSSFKRNLKAAFKSVLLNYREFIGIYVSVIIVQLLLGTWTLSAFTNHSAGDGLFDEHYSYDLAVDGSSAALAELSNVMRYDVISEGASFTDFELLRGSEHYRLTVILKPDGFEDFYEEYLAVPADKGEISYTLTPKYVYRSEIQKNVNLSSIFTGALSVVVGMLILNVMYSIRTNHYKYQYGVYMTCGADKKMLGGIAARELSAINALALLPSLVLSYLVCLWIYHGTGTAIRLNVASVAVYLLLCTLTVLTATGLTVGSLVLKTPISLITTADNSNFVSSPRRSKNIFGKKFPVYYELLSAWRFRKYLARLILGAVAFSVIFVVGIYSANMIKAENTAPKEEFIITYQYSTKTEEQCDRANIEASDFIPDLLNVKNVETLACEQSSSLDLRMDHILLQSGAERSGANITVPSNAELDGYTRAMNACKYVCMNEVALSLYERDHRIEYLEGYDATRALSDDKTVILTVSMYGSQCFDFEPGDKIAVADMKSVNTKLPVETDPQKQLRRQITNCTFEYTEYTVAAVIYDDAATDELTVGVTPKTYYRYTGDNAAISQVSAFVSSGLDLDDINALRADVKELMGKYSDSWRIENTDASVYAAVDSRINLHSLIYALSVLVLLISPVAWIFSQIMFYKKRETEFDTLRAMGATVGEIGQIHLVSGILIFIVSFIANFALSRALCYIIYKIFGRVLPELGVSGLNVPFDSFVPMSTVLIFAVLSAVCGILSSVIPFLLYRKKLIDADRAVFEITAENEEEKK